MRSLHIVIGCVAALLVPAATAMAACTCGQTWPAGAFEAAQVVFEGRAIASHGLTDEYGRRWQEATFSVTRAWKAAGNDTVTVRTPVGKDQCGLDFWIGESYLVYARSTDNGTLRTTRCDRTEFIEYASEDIAYLENRWDHSPSAGDVFPDVPTDHPAYQAVMDMYGAGLMTGYRDGMFRPQRHVSRAEIVKVLIDSAPGYRVQNDAAFGDPFDAGWLHFRDVQTGDWFVPYLRTAVRRTLVQGYRDGTFRPQQSVGVAEASKMIAVAFGLSRDWDGPLWYEQYVRALALRGALPKSIGSAEAPLTRGELAQIIWRLREGRSDLPAATAESVLHQRECALQDDPRIEAVDMRRVRAAWLEWYNVERARLGLRLLSSDETLNHVSYTQALAMQDQEYVQSSSYPLLRRTLGKEGLTYAGALSAWQSAGTGEYACKQSECTDELLAALRRTFDAIQSQRDYDVQPDWEAVTDPEYRLLGLGVVVADGRYTLVSQVARHPLSQPEPLCRQAE